MLNNISIDYLIIINFNDVRVLLNKMNFDQYLMNNEYNVNKRRNR